MTSLTKLTNRFLHRVRIHGGEFDESARAIHRQAASENVSVATIERKTMSTKTTLKRIALVAVAATGFGLMSAVPSNAITQSDTLSLSATTSSTTIGVAATVTLTQTFISTVPNTDSMTVTASLVSGPSGNVALPQLTILSDSTNAIVSSADSLNAVVASNATAGSKGVTGKFTASMTGVTAGNYVIKFTPAVGFGGGTLQAAAVTWTVTVAAATTASASTSTSYIASGEVLATTADSTVAVVRTANVTTSAATINVTTKDASSVNISARTILTASISGPGTLGFGDTSSVATITSSGRAITGTAGQDAIAVFADGTAGVATITISAGSLVLATETVTFYGDVATITPTLVNSVIGVDGTAGSGVITAIAKDSAGNVVANAALTLLSDSLSILNLSYASSATTGVDGKATFTISDAQAVAVGMANVTVTTATSSSSTSVINGTAVAVRVGTATPASVTVIFDKNAYAVGETATITISLKDAAGNAVPNGRYDNIFASGGLTSNFAITGNAIDTTTVTTSGSTGNKTYTVAMPTFAADVVLSATGGTGLPTAAQVAITSSTAVVSNPSNDAATDAANAATDAANYAADAADAATVAAEEATAAAQAAQESADAATAAVVELSTKTSALVDALRAQLTGLGNYVAKVAAALGRIGTRQNQILFNQNK